MITQRDKEILRIIEEFECMSSRQIQRIFGISVVIANRRLRNLFANKQLNRIKDDESLQMIYVKKGGKFSRHKLIIAEIYSRLKGDDVEFEREYTIGSLRADASFTFKTKEYKFKYLLEVQLCHEKPDLNKYEKLLECGNWNTFPRILVVYDGRLPQTYLRIIQVKSDLSNFNDIYNP